MYFAKFYVFCISKAPLATPQIHPPCIIKHYHPTYDKASFYQVDCLSLFENVIQIQHQKLFSVQKP